MLKASRSAYFGIFWILLFTCAGCGVDESTSVTDDSAAGGRLPLAAMPYLVAVETSRLDFMGQEAHGTLGEGWWNARGQVFDSNPLNAGFWSMSLESTLYVTVLEPRDLVMGLVMQPHFDASLPAQEVRILWNEVPLPKCSFEKRAGWNLAGFTVPVPGSAMVAGLNKITFVSKHAASAKEVGRGSDPRRVAFSLYSLSLVEANQSMPAYSPNSHGQYPKPAPVRFEDAGIAQWGTSALTFPLRPRADEYSSLRGVGRSLEREQTGGACL